MTAPIIRLQRQGEGLVFHLERPVGFDDVFVFDCAYTAAPLAAIDAGLPQPGSVASAGSLLWDSLAVNDNVGHELTELVRQQPPGECVYVRIGGAEAERFPWEVLRAPNGEFLSLDGWPIARMTSVGTGGTFNATFDPPLNFTIVLAAAQVNALSEWRSIYGAIQGTTLALNVKVLVCEQEVYDAVTGLNDARFTAAWIESKASVAAALSGAHLVHLFCHGIGPAQGVKPYVQIATAPSWHTNEDSHHAIFEAHELAQPLQKSWFVTLNCCESAAGGGANLDGANSFAFSLMGHSIPAVVAMRRPISVAVASVFSGAHYGAIFGALDDALKHGTAIDWARALAPSRGELCDKLGGGGSRSTIAANRPEWSLPVLYVGPETMRISVDASANQPEPDSSLTPDPSLAPQQVVYLRNRLEALRDVRAHLRPDTPTEKSDPIDTEIAATFAQLYGNAAASR